MNSAVSVIYDERDVPHIFAENDYDLYFAQGYVVARDRLFQMELQARNAAGRLSEWLGERTLNSDLYQRRFGMVYGTERTLDEYRDESSPEFMSVKAYIDGVNAYVNSLSPERYPVEYKILGVEPGEWDVLMGSYLMNYMVQMLAGSGNDVQTTNTIARLGDEFVDKYISTRSRWMDPIIQPDHEWDFEPLTAQAPSEPFTPQWADYPVTPETDPGIGSNNWAVSGNKTSSGFTILAGDPHLNMSVPSIWYEMQLHAPGINTYGATIPGAPGIVIGFNNGLSWTSTNTGTDVVDWYEIEFRDEKMDEYFYDNEWHPTTRRVEVIEVRGAPAVMDTVVYTHHGPVVQAVGEQPMRSQVAIGHAVRWIGHEPNSNYIAYYKLNRAGTVGKAQEALRYFTAPHQNFALADTEGNIAMIIAGKFPLKWDGQGRTIGNGRDPLYDWQGWIPYEHNPQSVNPNRGFVSSANQFLTDESYPYYTDDNFASFERGRRINDLLSVISNITPQDFVKMQLDSYSYHGENALPVMLRYLDDSDLNETESKAVELLRSWDMLNMGDAIAPTLFHSWWGNLNRAIWGDVFNYEVPMRIPTRDRTVQMMIEEPDSPYYNDTRTDSTETLADLVNSSFRHTIANLIQVRGEMGDRWNWAVTNNTNLNHLGQIPGLGVYNLVTDGGAESVNAIRGSHGPSWRMVTEMNPDGIRAFGVYPGGQSGNPGSPKFDSFVETWRTGEIFELHFWQEKPID
jgi:penicillin amidase